MTTRLIPRLASTTIITNNKKITIGLDINENVNLIKENALSDINSNIIIRITT